MVRKRKKTSAKKRTVRKTKRKTAKRRVAGKKRKTARRRVKASGTGGEAPFAE